MHKCIGATTVSVSISPDCSTSMMKARISVTIDEHDDNNDDDDKDDEIFSPGSTKLSRVPLYLNYVHTLPGKNVR